MHPNKALVTLVFAMGGIIVVGMAALGYGLYQKSTDPNFSLFKSKPAAVPTASPNVAIPLPPGARIADIQVTGNRIIVQVVEDKDGKALRSGIMIIDAETGEVIKRLTFGDSQNTVK